MKTLTFSTPLNAPQQVVWEWATSVQGIQNEMMPLMKMTMPKSVTSLSEVEPTLNEPLFRSWILLLGIIPVDYSYVTLIEYESGQSFVEESRMGQFRLWRHARRVDVCETNPDACVIHDTLTFQPKCLIAINIWMVNTLFKHRHRQLKKRFNA